MTDLTSTQISKNHSKMLEKLAENYKRTKRAQLEWLIEREYNRLADPEPVVTPDPIIVGE